MRRFAFIDGCRGLAALFVVLHHFSVAWNEHRTLFGAAPLAVDFFFCLSGFVIAHAYEERLRTQMTVREYLVRRLVRLYPMYCVGGILGLAGLAALKAASLTDFTWQAMGQATLLHFLYIPYFNGFTERIFDAAIEQALFPLNNPSWSLFFELAFATTLYVVAARRPAWTKWFAGAGALFLVAYALRNGAAPGWGAGNFAGGVPRVMFAFFSGVLLYQHRHHLERMRPARPLMVAGALVLLLGMPRLPGFRDFWLLSSLVAVPLLVAAATTVRPGDRATRACDYAGRLSYPLYCVHYPLLMLLAATQWRPDSYPGALAAFVIASAVVSHVLMVGFDQPLRRRLAVHVPALSGLRRRARPPSEKAPQAGP